MATTLEPLALRLAPIRLRLHRPVVAATLLAAVLSVIWALFLANDAGDLAAQYAWTDFALKHPDSAYNLSWYGGMHPASYSLFSPYVMGLLGVRTTAVLAATLSATVAARLLVRSGIARPMLPALWAAFSLWCDVASGRVTFALGILFGLAAADLILKDLVPSARRLVAASLLGALATACSPVAGLFVEVLAAALFLTGRRRPAYILAAGPPVIVGATSLLFPFSGVQPFAWYFAALPFCAAVLAAVLVPRDWRTVRAGSVVYATGIALTFAIPSPIGSNAERLALLFGGVVLLSAALAGRMGTRRTVAIWLAFSAVAVWQTSKPVADLINTAPVTATIEHAKPLITELRRLQANRARVEVVPLRSHWEASGLAPVVNLARGWNRQADVERNPLFYDGTLTAATYRAWLRNWGVRYVVLPADEPDGAGLAESKLITSAPHSWLRPVWQDAHWRLFRVTGTRPLADAPATVTHAGSADLTVHVPAAGSYLLRIPYSPWLGIEGATDSLHGCLSQSGTWTRLQAPAAGTYRIGARYALTRGTPCEED
ncbi:MFS transporter [Streptomyces sp. NBC_01262]|uniref:MFS transporter n=1 Tax=Streptomyces sp. NBC_01262 TaxID=2903803 RepID=UPI002E32BD85|nr:MFS transporter [Streptomyces sp. NBC_01262]